MLFRVINLHKLKMSPPINNNYVIILNVNQSTYIVWSPLIRDVLFDFLSEVPVTNWAAQ